jgi:hypothetical protein
MRYEIILNRNGCREALEVAAATFKNWKVWNVKLHSGEEAVLFKCGSMWLQRNIDMLDHGLLAAIGERIDHICLGMALS